ISGDGFFVVRKGNEQLYTRAGAFDFDANGRLVTPEGGLVQGWAAAADGSIDQNGELTDLRLPIATLMGATATETATFEGNLPTDAAPGTVLNRQVEVYDAAGKVQTLQIAFTRTGTGWDVAANVTGTTMATTG